MPPGGDGDQQLARRPALGHEPALALGLGLAGLVGLLTLLASEEAQRTIRTWIQHRAETRIAAGAYRIRCQIRAATCGPRRTTADAAQIRDTAATLNPDPPALLRLCASPGTAVPAIGPHVAS